MLLQAYRGVLSARGVNIYEEVDRIDWTEVSEGVDKKNDGKVAPGPSSEAKKTSERDKGKESRKALSFFKVNKSKSGDKDNESAKIKEERIGKPKRLKDYVELPIPGAG